MPLLSVCCRDMPCVRIDLFIGKDPERVLNGFIPETGQRFTHDYLHRSAANSPCSIENAITYSVLLFYFKSVPEGSFFMNKKLAAIVLAAVLAGSVIAGCGSSSGGGTASSGSGEPAAAEAEAETGGETEEETQTVDAIDTSAAAVEDVAETAASVEAATTVSEAASTAASSAAETAVETDPVAQAAALIDAIYVQERTETTDADIEAARNAWNALTDEQKALVEGEDADPDYFGRDTGDASLDDPRNDDEIGENELLVVSFGTSFNESRVEDIGGIEKALQEANPDWSVRRAFTSQIIINHVQARDEEVIDNVDQALARAKANGVKNLVVQPTHLMHGAEHDELMASLKAVEGDFETIRVAEPLLGQVGEDASVINEDKAAVARAVAAAAAAEAGYEGEDAAASIAAAAEDGTAFVFMGHGTAHVAKVSYSQMQTQMDELGYNNVFIGTVEGEPDQIIEKVKAAGYKKVILRPLMVVAGDHANNDMAGDEEDSWKSMFMADGSFDQVDCQVEGLGRIPEVQALYAAHTTAALDSDPAAGTAVSGEAEGQDTDLEDGTYTATFTTDGSMFHVNEAYDNKGTLTVTDGQMTIHVSLVSKNIVNLFPGTAEGAQAEGAALLEPTTDSVEYADGTTDEVYGFDIPVPAIGEEFDCALVGEKGKWYDHKVMVTDPVKAE